MSAPNLGWLTWLAMILVLLAAAVLSFAALRDLAELCGVDPLLAPLLPIAIDAGAAVSTRVWLDGRAVAAERYARTMTFALLASTVAGNALHGGLVASGVRPAWWVAVGVTAIPPAVVGAVVHLAVLVGRSPGRGTHEVRTPAGAVTENAGDEEGYMLASTPSIEQGASSPTEAVVGFAPTTTQDRARDLIAEGAGRRRLARELGVSEYEARGLIAAQRNGHGDGQVAR